MLKPITGQPIAPEPPAEPPPAFPLAPSRAMFAFPWVLPSIAPPLPPEAQRLPQSPEDPPAPPPAFSDSVPVEIHVSPPLWPSMWHMREECPPAPTLIETGIAPPGTVTTLRTKAPAPPPDPPRRQGMPPVPPVPPPPPPAPYISTTSLVTPAGTIKLKAPAVVYSLIPLGSADGPLGAGGIGRGARWGCVIGILLPACCANSDAES